MPGYDGLIRAMAEVSCTSVMNYMTFYGAITASRRLQPAGMRK